MQNLSPYITQFNQIKYPEKERKYDKYNKEEKEGNMIYGRGGESCFEFNKHV